MKKLSNYNEMGIMTTPQVWYDVEHGSLCVLDYNGDTVRFRVANGADAVEMTEPIVRLIAKQLLQIHHDAR